MRKLIKKFQLGKPILTDFQDRDRRNWEKLHNKPMSEEQYRQWQQNVHKANQRTMQVGHTGAALATTLATLFAGGARSPVSPLLDPVNISGYANTLGLIAYNPYDWHTYASPEVVSSIAGSTMIAGAKKVIRLDRLPLGEDLPPGQYVVRGPNNSWQNFDWPGGVLEKPSAKSSGWLGVTRPRPVRDPDMYIETVRSEPKITSPKVRQIPKDIERKFEQTMTSPQSGIEWSPSAWFKTRTFDPNDPFKLTNADVDTFLKHVKDEYVELADQLYRNGLSPNIKQGVGALRKDRYGNWEGLFDGKWKRTDPNAYTMYHSKAARKANLAWDGDDFYSGMNSTHAKQLMKNNGIGVEKWASSNPGGVAKAYQSGDAYGQSPKLVTRQDVPVLEVDGHGTSVNYQVGNSEPKHLSEWLQTDSNGKTSGVTYYINDYIDEASSGRKDLLGPYSNPGIGKTKVFGEDTPVKSIFENNGDFDWTKHLFSFNNNKKDANNRNLT